MQIARSFCPTPLFVVPVNAPRGRAEVRQQRNREVKVRAQSGDDLAHEFQKAAARLRQAEPEPTTGSQACSEERGAGSCGCSGSAEERAAREQLSALERGFNLGQATGGITREDVKSAFEAMPPTIEGGEERFLDVADLLRDAPADFVFEDDEHFV